MLRGQDNRSMIFLGLLVSTCDAREPSTGKLVLIMMCWRVAVWLEQREVSLVQGNTFMRKQVFV